jgi:hypothetical protein
MDRAHPRGTAGTGSDADRGHRTARIGQHPPESRNAAKCALDSSGVSAIAHTALCLAVGALLAGCVDTAPQAQPAAPAGAAPSYDGRYEGRLDVTGASVGMDRRACEADPRFVVEVRGNRFSIVQPHPRFATDSPELRDSTTVVYDATIQPGGRIVGMSNRTNALMEGSVVGARMSGEIYGLLCYYAFVADRA